MDDLGLPVSVALPLLFLSLFIFNFFRKSGDDAEKFLPPGSLGWPIIGETLEFLFGKPEKFVWDRMKRHSPHIFKTKILGEKTVVLCGPEGHKFLFSNEGKLFTAHRPHSTQKIFRVYPGAVLDQIPREAEAKILRAPGFLKAEAVIHYLGEMDSITQQLLRSHWEGKREAVKVVPFARTLSLTLACRFFLGSDDPGRVAGLVGNFDDITLALHSIPWNIPGTIFYRATKGAAAVGKELIAVIKEKKAAMAAGQPMRDVLSHMMAATDPTGRFMTEEELAYKIMGLLVAGYGNVSSAITLLMKCVGERPHIYNKILAEQSEIAATKQPGDFLVRDDILKMKYSWNTLYEVMRFTPPLQGTFRTAIEDFTYAGYNIPKGWKVYWTVSSTTKNPTYFPDPEKFDPTRYEEGNGSSPPPFAFVPFGGGPRMCPGKEYARFAILTFLHNVVKRYKWKLLLPNEKIVGNMTPTPQNGLPVLLQPH